MSENRAFLINGLDPAPTDNTFQVRTNAVRLFGANLGVAYNVEVFVGDPSNGAWVPAYFNGQQLQITDTNNILVLIVSGQYRVVTSDSSTPLSTAIIWYEESIETDHDARVMYILQTPSPPSSGGGGGPTPSDNLPMEVGNFIGRLGAAGVDTAYSRDDHVHPISAIPNGTGQDVTTAVQSGVTGVGSTTVISAASNFIGTTREAVGMFLTVGATSSIPSVACIQVPTSVNVDGYSWLLMTWSVSCEDQFGGLPVTYNAFTGQICSQVPSGATPDWNPPYGGNFYINAVYTLIGPAE